MAPVDMGAYAADCAAAVTAINDRVAALRIEQAANWAECLAMAQIAQEMVDAARNSPAEVIPMDCRCVIAMSEAVPLLIRVETPDTSEQYECRPHSDGKSFAGVKAALLRMPGELARAVRRGGK